MARKTNKQLLKEQVNDALKVEDLIKELQKYDPKMPIGVGGHFGEILFLRRNCVYKREGFITPDGFWRNNTREYLDYLDISTPDIGPAPD